MTGSGDVLAQKEEGDSEDKDDEKKPEPSEGDAKGGDQPEESKDSKDKTEQPAGQHRPSGNIEFFTKIAEFFDAKFSDILKEDKEGKISAENQKKAQEMCANVNEWYDEAKEKLKYFDYENKEQTSLALESYCNTYVAVRTHERPAGGEKPTDEPDVKEEPKGGEQEDKPTDEGDAKGDEKKPEEEKPKGGEEPEAGDKKPEDGKEEKKED